MSTADRRTPEFRRNQRLEALLEELNALLEPCERRAAEPFDEPLRPPVLIVGPPRTGSTLILQWLAASGAFCYPSNLLSRFFRAPYLGARITRMVADPAYDFRGELADMAGTVSFESELGKTRGALAPNEFYYFWRRFFPFGDDDLLGAEGRRRSRPDAWARGLAAIEAAFDKPLALKASIVNLEIDFVDRALPRAVWLALRRDPLLTIQSLLLARERHRGDRRAWYSFKPAEYEELRDLDPVGQVTGQVFYLRAAVAKGLARLAPERRLEVDYEAFCRDPARTWAALAERLAAQGCALDANYTGPARFEASCELRLSAADRRRAAEVWKALSGEPLPARCGPRGDR